MYVHIMKGHIMEGIINNTTVSRANYHATAKGAIGGAAAGAAIIGGGYGAIKTTQSMMKKADYASKKKFIKAMTDIVDVAGLNHENQTISQMFKTAAKGYLNPKFIAKTMAPLAAVGAAIGFGVDMVKNSAMRLENQSVKKA